MVRRNIPFLPNNYYHVYNRGANKAEIFCDRKDYLLLLRQIKRHVNEFEITVIAYCLMSNHFHLILCQDGPTKISDFMQAVFHKDSMSFNQSHRHSGTLFEGLFRAILIEKDEYLLHLYRYIHRNPLEAGIVKQPEQ
jgi:putative transposase